MIYYIKGCFDEGVIEENIFEVVSVVVVFGGGVVFS